MGSASGEVGDDGAMAGKGSSVAKLEYRLRVHGFRRGSHERGEEVKESPPGRTLAALKEQGERCA